MRKVFGLIGIIVGTQFIVSLPAFAQPNTWAKAYGGAGEDWGYSVWQTQDRGYIVAGGTYSCGAGGSDFLVFKLDSTGDMSWARTFGGTYDDRAYRVQQTQDNGYIVIGETYSYGEGSLDWLAIKLNSDGEIDWARTFGGAQEDIASFVQQTSDDGYILTGWTKSFGAGKKDLLVIELDSTGNIVWAKTFGKTEDDMAHSVQQTQDGGYIVVGETWHRGKDGKAYDSNILVIKLTSTGDTSWAGGIWPSCHEVGVVDYLRAYSVQQTSDLGYIIAGETNKYGAGNSDFLVVKLTSTCDASWARTFGGTYNDRAYSIQQVSGGGYVVAGETEYSSGRYKSLIIKLTSTGDIRWAKTFTDTSSGCLHSVQQTNDKGYVLIGSTNSYGMHQDVLVVKFESDGSMQNCSPFHFHSTETSSCSPSAGRTSVPSTSSPSVVETACTPETSSVLLTVTDICPEEGVEEHESYVHKLQLEVFPNPFTTLVRVQWLGVDEGQKVSLKVYDLGGRLVKTLLNNEVISGNKIEVRLDELTKGIYFVKMEAGNFTATKKIILMR